MKRSSSSRVWVFLGFSAVLFTAASIASRRFPPAPVQAASVELRGRLDSLRGFDAAALEKVRGLQESAGAAALSAAKASETRTYLAKAWETTALPSHAVGDLSIVLLTLRRSGDWQQLLGAIRQVQQVPGVSVSAASVFARGSVLSVELHARIVAHTQPANDKASGLPAVVRSPEIR